jgi:hypothetical protein
VLTKISNDEGNDNGFGDRVVIGTRPDILGKVEEIHITLDLLR